MTPNGSSRRAEELGIRVRTVNNLAEGALYFRKQGLLLLDRNLNQDRADGLVDGVVEEYEQDLSPWGTFWARWTSGPESRSCCGNSRGP